MEVIDMINKDKVYKRKLDEMKLKELVEFLPDKLKQWGRKQVTLRERKLYGLHHGIHDKSMKTSIRVNDEIRRLEIEIDLLNEIFEIVEFKLNVGD